MKRNAFVLWGLSIVCSLICLSCKNGNSKNDSGPADGEVAQESSTDTPEQQPVTINNTSPKLNKANNSILYLDCSRSMAGYIEAKNSSVFNNVIAGLLYRADSSSAHLFDLEEKTEIGRDEFINRVNNKNIQWSSESNLGKMINAMANNYTSGRATISYLISDGIMSGTNDQISADREYNKTHYGHSQEEIESALKKCGPDASILVVRYVSGFTTNPGKQFYYYCYDNSRVELKDANRPFFIVALGTLESVKSLRDDIKGNARLSGYTDMLLLGDSMPYKVDFRPAYQGGASMRQDGFCTLDRTIRSETMVKFNINLTALQDYMINEEYINQNGSLLIQSRSNSPIVMSRGNYESSLSNNILALGIKSEQLRGATLSYKIRYSLPSWVNTLSSSDDKNVVNDVSPKTFNLKYFIEALAVVNKPHIGPDGYINQTEDVQFR